MTIKIYTKLLFFVLLSTALHAQDLHFSQFDKTPLLFNPGQTGNFKGTIRLGAIYRDQWRNFGNFHTTPSFFIDAPVIKGFGKNDWVGAGGVIFQDRAGAGRFGNGAFLLSGAYHKGIGKAGKHVVSLGFQYGTGSLRVRRPFAYTFEDGLENPSLGSIETGRIPMEPQRYTEFATGAVYTYKLTDLNDRIYVGLNAAHISFQRRQEEIDPTDTIGQGGGGIMLGRGGGRYGVLPTGFYRRPFRFNLSAGLDMVMNDVYILRPAFMAQLYGGHLEIVLNAVGGFVINKEEEIAITGGIGYRVADSGIVQLGMDYKTLRVGIAYDVNVSSLGAASAFEIGATYIVRIQKRPTVNPVIFCPRF